MNEQELNKKLAEWAGFRFVDKELGYRGVPGGVLQNYWVYPDGNEWLLPDFTQSLNACFEWLVPNLMNDEYFISLSHNPMSDLEEAYFANIMQQTDIATTGWAAASDNPALALCLAIEKLIDMEEK